jgi:tetratricopeptide (TPR) repeat protein
MPKENQDRDAIVTKAIGISSEQERADYIAQACGDNAELKRQVDERVAEHFQANRRSAEDRGMGNLVQRHPGILAAAAGMLALLLGGAATKSRRNATPPENTKEKLAQTREEVRTVAREHPRISWISAIFLLLLFVFAAGGAGLAVWEGHEAKQARKAEEQAVEKSEKAEKEAKEAKGKYKRAQADVKERIRERDQAQEGEKEAKRSEQELKAIIAFLKSKLLATGRPGDISLPKAFWYGTQGKDVTVRKGLTLRQAVDEAESKIAEVFADRPTAEASVREILGLAYLNLGAAKEAVQQFERAFELREAVQGDNASETADCRNQLAVAYRLAGRHDEASRLFHHKPDSPTHASALVVRGLMLLEQKKPAEAELKLRESLTISQKTQPDDWTTFETKSILSEALLDQKKYAEAEPLLLSGYHGMLKRISKIPSPDRGQLNRALERLVRLYEAWGKKDHAAKWRKELERAKQ